MTDIYKYYKDNYGFFKKNINQKIVGEFNKFFMAKVFKGEELILPCRLGRFRIISIKETVKIDEEGKIKGVSPNWRLTKELWEENKKAKKEKKLVYNLNLHSNKLRYRFHWTKVTSRAKNVFLYSFRASRTNKRKLHNNILEGKEYKTIN